MTTIELNDPFTGEWTSFLETDFTYNGSSITDALCDNVLYKKVNGKYYRRILIENIINAKWFGVTGDAATDDTVKMNEAISKSAVANGILFFPEGKYKITGYGLDLLSNSNLTGVGKDTVFEMVSGASWCISANKNTGGTEHIKDNIKNIKVRNIQFISSDNTFAEHAHLMNLNAVSDVIIEGCYFTQFRGDGIYIGSSNLLGEERHNERISIRDCHFDGVNHYNRNGITIVDCNIALIEDCTFKNCTGNGLPGAIDIEPDSHIFHIVKNIVIRNNRFQNIGGGPGVISVQIAKITDQCQNILIENNHILECKSSNYLYIATSKGATSVEELNDCMVTVQNNIFEGTPGLGNQAFAINQSKNVRLFDNTFTDFDGASFIGYKEYISNPNEDGYVSDIFIERNLFHRLGITKESSFNCFDVKNLHFKNNELRKSTNQFFFYFIRGNSSELFFEHNKFINENPTIPAYSIVMGETHNTQENTNTFTKNIYDNNMYLWNYHWLRNSAPANYRNVAPPNGHIFYNETLQVSQIFLGGTWKTIKMEP